MGDEAKQAWMQVGERFGAVGKRLAERYNTSGDDTDAKEAERKLEEIAREVADRIERAVDAVDGTVRDPAARTDFKDALNALGDAITATAHDIGSAVRGGGDGEDQPRPDQPAS